MGFDHCLIDPYSHSEEERAYKIRKVELFRERAGTQGFHALVSASICKKLIERDRLEREQSMAMEKPVEQKKEDVGDVVAVWELPVFLKKEVNGEINFTGFRT